MARNCLPCSRSMAQFPDAETYSPGEIMGVCPIRVTSSRSPLTLMRRTQKPFSALWKVTRSTRPARRSCSLVVSCGILGFSMGGVAEKYERTVSGAEYRLNQWNNSSDPQHFLNFLPEPHGHGSLRPTLASLRRKGCVSSSFEVRIFPIRDSIACMRRGSK
ncbi:hypothetical protein FEMY_24330 [Ferrovum myxofaciens]|uniref:Uncharacterized protein n=1 Tax=Ferrovum myxofaciens TaxID=416213 RepID=A0A149VV09_9PROT|nr:hypothetical protein FEMY_24330 [Ferrovum myxofaciens]